MSTDAWHDLLTQLRGQLPELVDRFLSALGERAIYDTRLVPEADLRLTAEQTLSMLIDRLMGIDTGVAGADAAALLGKRRATTGGATRTPHRSRSA